MFLEAEVTDPQLHQLGQQQVAEVIDLPKFRHLLKEELQQEDARKAAMTRLNF